LDQEELMLQHAVEDPMAQITDENRMRRPVESALQKAESSRVAQVQIEKEAELEVSHALTIASERVKQAQAKAVKALQSERLALLQSESSDAAEQLFGVSQVPASLLSLGSNTIPAVHGDTYQRPGPPTQDDRAQYVDVAPSIYAPIENVEMSSEPPIDVDLDLEQTEPTQADKIISPEPHNQTEMSKSGTSPTDADGPGYFFARSLSNQLEFELKGTKDHRVDKLVLLLIEVTGLGLCGIDRCFMGQCCLGTLKGVTLGGLSVWMLIDAIITCANGFSKSDSIDSFGFVADFQHSSIAPAYCASVVGIVMLLWCPCCIVYKLRHREWMDRARAGHNAA
jgi:hypothetical protein